MKFAVDSQDSAWYVAVGKLMLNFGAIELLSLVWVDTLGQDEVLRYVALEMQFSKRVELILRLVKRSRLPTDLDKRIRETWAAAKRLSDLRNDIAHSPLVFGPQEDRPPDHLGTWNVRKVRTQPVVPLVELSAVRKGVNEVVKVTKLLDDLLKESMGVRGVKKDLQWDAVGGGVRLTSLDGVGLQPSAEDE